MSKSRYSAPASDSDRQYRRELAGMRNAHHRNTADADLREQLDEVTFAPAYTGKVGTHKPDLSFIPKGMPARAHVQGGQHTAADSAIDRVIEHVVPATRLIRQSRTINSPAWLAQNAAFARARLMQAQEREDRISMSYMREIGFGGHHGVYVED